jgi:hypothetical protein
LKPHVFDKLPKAKKEKHSRIPWVCCRRCGLVAIRNKTTEQAIRKPCPGLDDE